MSNDIDTLNLISTENGYRLKLIDKKNISHEYISHAWGSDFQTFDIKYVRKVANNQYLPNHSELKLPTKFSEFFICEGKVSNGWKLGVIGDSDETNDIQITLHKSSKDYESALIDYQKNSSNEEDKKLIFDSRLGKSISDWEIQTSSTHFWLTIDLSHEVFDLILDMYNQENLDSIEIRISFKFANLYTDSSQEHLPFASSSTYYLLPDEKYGIRSPKMATGHVDLLSINGKKHINTTEHRLDLEGNQDHFNHFPDENTKNISLDTQIAATKEMAFMNSQLITLNQTLKYVMYGVVIFVLINILK